MNRNLDYIKYVREQITNAIKGSSNISYTIGFYEEFSNNPRNDIDITVKRLTGRIENNVVTLPYQIMITCRQDLVDIIKPALDHFAFSLNETNVFMPNEEDTGDILTTQYYAPYSVLQANVDIGMYKATTLTMSATLIYSEEYLLKCKFIEITVDEYTKAFDVLQTAFTWTPTTSTSGGMANNKDVKSLNQNSIPQYSFTIAAISCAVTDIINEQLILNKHKNKKYQIWFTLDNDISFTIDCILSNISYTDSFNGYPAYNLTFVKGDFNGESD